MRSTSETQPLDSVVIKFAGDSGDGMQITGSRFTTEAALAGNDLRTFPDFPAEIRAPAGTLAGVSAFQLHFADGNIFTPGDRLDVLVAMNPAALKTNLDQLKTGGILIVNIAEFNKRNLAKAGYDKDPLADNSLDRYKIYAVDITKLTTDALTDSGLSSRSVDRCKNFFTLGLLFWMYNRSPDNTVGWLNKKFSKTPDLAAANVKVLKAGYYYGETTEIFDQRYEVKAATIEPGRYRNISGNSALALGLVVAAERSGRELFLGSYPITPASDILHELSLYKNYGVHTFQAEDEIAAVSSAIGAAYGGALGATTTSGPGVALKTEGLGLAVMTELPLIVINIQRGGPSTGLPTKTEQADLFQAVFGRNGEAPMPVVAAASPGDCFDTVLEAARIALTYMTPVFVLSDGSLANGTEPWKLPDVDAIPRIDHHEVTDNAGYEDGFQPYIRDPKTLARPWARPGTPGLEHRIGGLEKEHITGGVSYDPQNHEFMIRLRAEKLVRLQDEIPPTKIHGDESGDLLLIGWGSTRGVIRVVTDKLRRQGHKVSAVHLRYVNPLPKDIGEIMARFKTVACPEMNMGQLSHMLRAIYLRDVKRINKVQGVFFMEGELLERCERLLAGEDPSPFLIETLEMLTGERTSEPPPSAAAFARYQ